MRRSTELTLLVFAVLGPPIGLVTYTVMSVLGFVAWETSTHGFSPLLVFQIAWLEFFLVGLVPSYILGVVPAVTCGGLVAWVRKKQARGEPLWIASIGTIVGIGYALCLSMVFGLPVAGTSEPLNLALVYNVVLLALTCIVSTLVCWVIVRRRDEPERIPA